MTKTYELSILENWLRTIIPDMITAQPIDPDILKTQVDWVVTESYRVQRELQIRFHELKPRHADQYINMNQMDLLRIMDIVEDYISTARSATKPDLTQFFSEVYSALEKILVHLVKYFPSSINAHLPMPHRYAQHEKEKLRLDYDQLLHLYDHPHVPKPLLDVAIRPLKEFLLRDNTAFTFYQLLYFKVFLYEMLPCLDIIAPPDDSENYELPAGIPLEFKDFDQVGLHSNGNGKAPKTDINKVIHYKLHFINFNNLEYRNYCTVQLHHKLEALPTQKEKIERVNWYVTTERRQRPRPGLALEPGLPPISEQILHIIEEEYQYLIEQNNLQSTNNAELKHPPGNKLKLGLTSIEMAQLASVGEEAGLIKAKVVDIISHIARNCVTEGGDDIQESSLRTQFYSRNAAALQKISTILQAMQDVVQDKLKNHALTFLWVIISNSFFGVT